MTCLRYSFFILMLLLGLSASQAAVPAEAHSTVTDAEDGGPVAGAIVQGLGTDGKPLSYTRTDAMGTFRLRLNPGTATVSVRAMGYETAILRADSLPATIILSPKATALHEVIVKAPDIYAKGDTLVFSVDRFAKAGDDAIIDVIKRLPGVTVRDDGTIEYQGKPINKFYIDGNDFIGGQYGLATENISHEDVKSVEVMENHQPVKALEGIDFPEEAGMNIKLKEDAGGQWMGVARGSAGVQPVLYSGSLFGMRIAPALQSIFTLRADNTGWNPESQTADHEFQDMFDSSYDPSPWPGYISADITGSPLAERRTRDNLSWIADVVTAWRRGDTSMRLKAGYCGDRLDYATSDATRYFSGSTSGFTRHNTMRTLSHQASVLLNAEVNRRGYYLKDCLTVKAGRGNSRSAITGTLNLTQLVGRKTISVANDLKLVRRNDRRLFTIMSRNSVYHSPADLTIGDTSQHVGTTDLRSTTELRQGWFVRWWKIYVHAGADLGYHRADLSLSGLGSYDNTHIHDIFTSAVYASPRMDYDRLGWRVSLTIPVRWVHYRIGSNHDYASVSPNIYARRQLTAKSDLSVSVRYRLSPEAPYMFVGTPVLRDYHNLFVARPCGGSQSISATAGYRYRNPLNAMFANISATCLHTLSHSMSNRIFDGNLIISTFAARRAATDRWTVDGSVSKGLGHGKMLAGLDTGASLSTGTSMSDGIPTGWRQSEIEARPYIKGTPFRQFSFDYEARLTYSSMTVGNAVRSDYVNLTQRLSATYTLHDDIHLTAGAEHYMTRPDNSATSNLILVDASASWQVNSKMRLSLTAANLLDSRHYGYVSYGTLSESSYTYRLRPRSILATAQLRF